MVILGGCVFRERDVGMGLAGSGGAVLGLYADASIQASGVHSTLVNTQSLCPW